ncbi:acyltransferase family protein [Treponema brennaborense]|uniref:acyltransferase family protein n=1 Tax=Treponema brennaborense TaxID=81028 RepID=UPI0012EA8F07|nr:acyltransferase family protein [Treponema brennaborense]
MITSYFMCKQDFKWKKVINLVLEIILYRWVISGIFLLTGYEQFSLKEFYKTIFVIPFNFGKGFTSSFLGLYILIPFVNKFILCLDKKSFEKLIITLLILFTGLSSFLLNTAFEYIGWYITVYFIGCYIRLYEMEWMKNKKTTILLCVGTLLLSWLSIVVIRIVSVKINKNLLYYWFVSDSNKILAITTAIGLFLYFKNIKIGSNKVINIMAASTFGVLMIHASSDTMRRWLWQDVCKNVEAFTSNKYFILHAFCCTLSVYFICMFIDVCRKYIFGKIIQMISKMEK